MQHMRYLNLFESVTRIRTRFCFNYNEAIFFCVPRQLVSKAIGDGARNIRRLNEILGKKIRVVAIPEGEGSIKRFIEAIVNPVIFKDLAVNENEVIISASTQSKAALIGRNKRRLLEMQKIMREFFGREFRIV